MQAIKAHTQIYGDVDAQQILNKIKNCCINYCELETKSEEDSVEKFVSNIMKNGSESALEHVCITVKFIVDRATSHELIKDRSLSCYQESKPHFNCQKEELDSEMIFIIPENFDYNSEEWNIWKDTMKTCENAYLNLIDLGVSPEEAMAILPNSLKTEVVVTANIRKWRTFLKLKTITTTYPQMREVTRPLLDELKELIPIVFDDITY